MADPKKQHIIPQCYLKQFVDSDTPSNHEPYVWLFEKEQRRGKKKAPKNILAETDFYTLQLRGGRKDYTIEKSLAQIEGEYASVFDTKISNRLSLNDDDHTILCAFTAAMLQRTLKQRQNIEHFMDQVIQHVDAMERQHGMTARTSQDWNKQRQEAHKLTLLQLSPEIARILTNMNLAILCSNKRDMFITSDTPCHLFNYRLQWQRSSTPALAQKHVEVRMPLSPELAVCFSWANNLRGYLEIGSDLIHETNRMVYLHSHQYFIANSPKVKRRWFRRFPLDPVFIVRIIANEAKQRFTVLQQSRKHHV